jgi:hypothetical protein
MIARAQPASRTNVVVIVIEDGSPCPWAKVTIRPQGKVEGWSKGTAGIVLTADDKGRATTHLGPGSYWVTAVDSIAAKEPESGPLKITSGQKDPAMIRLILRYWDCAHVTCEV